jgi:8-oxo-dGTP diphosphatase
MKTEISAGGVIVQKRRSTWRVLLIQDMNNAWTFPKGRVEKKESRKNAAIREIGEEVGLNDIKYITPLSKVNYLYRRNGLVSKSVYYYLFEAIKNEPLVCQKNEGIKNASWVSIDTALGMAGYPKTNTRLIRKVQKLLRI